MTINKSNGFTLVELMVVVALIGIMSAIALPGYQSYVLKTHRAKAQNYLVNLASAQEAYYQRNGGFASLAELATTGLTDGVQQSDIILDDRYEIFLTTSNDAFSLQLTAKDTQSTDSDCLFIRVDQDTLIEGKSANDLCSTT